MTNTCLRSSGLPRRRFAARTRKRRGGSPTGLGGPYCPPRRSSPSCTSAFAGTAFFPRSKPRLFPTTLPSRLRPKSWTISAGSTNFPKVRCDDLADDQDRNKLIVDRVQWVSFGIHRLPTEGFALKLETQRLCRASFALTSIRFPPASSWTDLIALASFSKPPSSQSLAAFTRSSS